MEYTFFVRRVKETGGPRLQESVEDLNTRRLAYGAMRANRIFGANTLQEVRRLQTAETAARILGVPQDEVPRLVPSGSSLADHLSTLVGFPQHYELLGVDHDAGREEVTASYGQRVAETRQHFSAEDAPREIARLTAARDTLLDPKERLMYDSRL